MKTGAWIEAGTGCWHWIDGCWAGGRRRECSTEWDWTERHRGSPSCAKDGAAAQESRLPEGPGALDGAGGAGRDTAGFQEVLEYQDQFGDQNLDPLLPALEGNPVPGFRFFQKLHEVFSNRHLAESLVLEQTEELEAFGWEFQRSGRVGSDGSQALQEFKQAGRRSGRRLPGVLRRPRTGRSLA